MKKQIAFITLVFWISVCLVISGCRPAKTMPLSPTGFYVKDISAQTTPATSTPFTATASESPTPNPGMKIIWAYQTGAAAWSTPSVVDGIVYFGSDDNNLYAVNSKNGTPKWKFTTQGFVRSQPAIANGLVYFSSDDGYLYALNQQSGQLAWRTDIGNSLPGPQREKLGSSDPRTYDYRQSSPIVGDGQVFVGSLDGNVYSLEASTGKISWAFRTGEKVRATPTLDNNVVYIGSWDMSVYALDARTGKQIWKSQIGGQVQSAALVADGVVYDASRKASVVALDAQTGDIIWDYSYGTNMWVESSPILMNDFIYIGSSGSRMVMGIDRKSGKFSSIFFATAFTWSTPVIVGSTLYIGGTGTNPEDNSGLMAIKLTNGKMIMDYQSMRLLPVKDTLEAENIWSGVASSPVIADNIIYFTGLDGKCYAVRDLVLDN